MDGLIPSTTTGPDADPTSQGLALSIAAIAGNPGRGPFFRWHIVIDIDGRIAACSGESHACVWASAIRAVIPGLLRGHPPTMLRDLPDRPWQREIEGFPVGRWPLIQLVNQSLRQAWDQWCARAPTIRSSDPQKRS